MADIDTSIGAIASSSHALDTRFVARFPTHVRIRVGAFAAASCAHHDLMRTFPAATLVAALCRCADVSAAAAIDLDRPLREIADELGVPVWMRALPPEALYWPLRQHADPESEIAFGAKIVNLLPKRYRAHGVWLRTIVRPAIRTVSELLPRVRAAPEARGRTKY